MNTSQQFIVNPSQKLQGTLHVPGDKSISHRAIMLGALAEGTTQINGFLEGEDTKATLQAFENMGVSIDRPDQKQVTLHGVGLQGLHAPGTSMRLLSGLMAGQAFSVEMGGDIYLSRRPMRRVTDPLTTMGAQIETSEKGMPPLKIKGGQRLQGINYTMPIASAQVKSCLLLAGLYAQGTTCAIEPSVTRDHTEPAMR